MESPIKLPWTDERGHSLPDTQLRVLSRSWSSSTWEAYLDWAQNQNECVTEDCPLSVPLESAPTSYLKLHANLHLLSPIARRVLHLRFWDSLLIEEIAIRINRTWEETDRIIETALAELKNSIVNPKPDQLCEAA